MRIRIIIAVSALAALWAAKGESGDTSPAAGYNTIPCPGGSDTVVGVPFRRPASFSGTVSGAPAVGGGTAVLTAAESPVFAAGEIAGEAHYLQFTGSGARPGRFYPVTANDAATFTIDLEGDDLAGVGDGDPFEVIPFWTLGTLFPGDTQTTIHVSAGKLAPGRKTRILFFDDIGDGIDLAPDRVYFLTANGWFFSKRGFPAADDTVIPPGKIFVIRHPAGDAATTFYPRRNVVAGDHATPLRTRATGPQDNSVGLVRPVPVKLSDLDLGPVFAASGSTDPADREDELLVYDDLAAAINRQPSTIYFRVGAVWRKDDGAAYPNADNDEIIPSTGLVIRKAATLTGETLYWVNTPRY